MVAVVAFDDTLQPLSNDIDRFMQALAKLRLQGVERRAHPLNHGLAPNNEMTFGVRRTVVREPQKREGFGLGFPTLLPIGLSEPTEFDHLRSGTPSGEDAAASAEAFASLFGSFISTMAQSDPSKTYMSG